MNSIPVAEPMPIRDAGLNEAWLQDVIWSDPKILGLGDLEGVQKERRQPTGGRLDILLKDPQDDLMFEVEIMLGETDETHIIRTIEYWDAEKRRWPQRQHKAVLIAEHINRRFFNVIHLLSHAIPIIAMQVTLNRVGDQRFLSFAKVLDTYQELDDGTASDGNAWDRAAWMRHAPAVISFADYFLEVATRVDPDVSLVYVQNYIAISGRRNYVWLRPRRNRSALVEFRSNDTTWEQSQVLLQDLGFSPNRKESSFVWLMGQQDMSASNADVFARILESVSAI